MPALPYGFWEETLPCGCVDIHYTDGTVDREHDHVICDGLPVDLEK